ncbi:rnf217 [Symbiodinium necroappetens]|uniref:Rnf217 protein n=1 Tax=Symbiodinium necroappetens TaxID=1628268 RepID=A0A813CBF6_9DINO|nr:rnf217 [Symbiodinium necroappetens]
MCCSTRAVTDIVESNHLAAPSCQKYVNVCFANCHNLTADWPCKAKLFAPAHTKCEKCLSGFSQRAVPWCFVAPFCYRCVLKACPLPASLGPIMSNRRYLHEAMTAEDVSKLFDSLCDTVVSALAKRDAEIEHSAASSFDPLQLILDFQSLQKEVRELKEDTPESHATRESPVAQSEAPPKFKQLEKQPQPNCSSRSLARAALQAVYGMVAQCAATEAQRPCPHRGGNSSVAEQRHSPCRTTRWKRTRSGGTDIRQGPHHARRDNAGFIREGECFTVVEERVAGTDGLFLRLEGEKGWVFSAGRSGIFCQRMGTEAAEGDGWAKDAWTWRGSTEQGSGSQRTWAREEQKWSGWNWNSYPSGSGGWVLGCLAKMCHDTATAMFFRVLPHISSPATLQEKENYCAKSGRHRSWRLRLLRTTRYDSSFKLTNVPNTDSFQ